MDESLQDKSDFRISLVKMSVISSFSLYKLLNLKDFRVFKKSYLYPCYSVVSQNFLITWVKCLLNKKMYKTHASVMLAKHQESYLNHGLHFEPLPGRIFI